MLGEKIKTTYDMIPLEEKMRIRDIFIEMLKKNHFKVEGVHGLQVDASITNEHPRIIKLFTPDQLNNPLFPHNFPPKLLRKVEVLEKKLQARLQAKAISHYFLHAVGAKA